MIFQQLNRSDAERIDLIVGNVDGGGSMTAGLGVALVEAGASIDGISAVKATAGTWKGFIGIATENIPINGYGLVRAHGLAAAGTLSNVGTSITITRGDVLIPSAIAGQFFSSVTPQAMSTLLYKYAYAADTITVSALTTVRAIVRAL